MEVNFGGFVSLSTVDWRGKAACTVFLRGCPLRCYYCHNPHLQKGSDPRRIKDILKMIEEVKPFISGVVISGGEPTYQAFALEQMVHDVHHMDLPVAVQTSGIFPFEIKRLIHTYKVDKISLDIKTTWEEYNRITGMNCAVDVQESLSICNDAHESGKLPEFEAVTTLVRGHENDVTRIAPRVRGEYVLQQAWYKSVAPLTETELINIARGLNRRVWVRTRDKGQVKVEP